jgi:hypothetical protein
MWGDDRRTPELIYAFSTFCYKTKNETYSISADASWVALSRTVVF